MPKYGNWRLQLAEHGVALSEDAPWDGLRILITKQPSVAYQMVPNIPNQKVAPLGTIFKFVYLT